MSCRSRRIARVLGVLVVWAVITIGCGGSAAAHPTLLFTEPGADTAVSDAPQAITLIFNETVTIGRHAVVLLDKDGREVPMGAAETARDGHVVIARPTATLPPGTYTVRWSATGTDGDQLEAEIRFGVGYALSSAASGGGGPAISWLDAGLRWLLFAGFGVAFGGLIGERVTASARAENPRLRGLRSPIVGAVLVAAAAVVGLGAQLVADAGTVSVLWRGGSGPVVCTEAAGLLAALVVIATGRRIWALLPLLVVIGAEGWRSHAQVAAPGWGAVLTGVHLGAAAIWVGALVQTARAVLAWRHERAAVRWVLAGYLRLAAATFTVVITTGVISALLLIPLSQVFSTSYGRVLLVKLGLVAAATGLALTGRLILRSDIRLPKLPSDIRLPKLPSDIRLPKLPSVIRAEGVILIVVLAASATLVSTPPVTAAAPQPAPPTPTGPVLPLGSLAGQIGVAAAVSDGQLVIRLSTPRTGDYYAPQADQDYVLSGRLDTAGADTTTLSFRGCGRGCFVSATTWGDGTNVLTLRAEADGWPGGTVSLLVPWPTQPGAEDLDRAVAAMRRAGGITVYESVTSDTSIAAREPQPLDLAADFFLSQEPYAAGTAPIAVRISRPDQPVRLALGYPAASIDVLLTLDGTGRITEETLTDAKHLVTRRFVYPDHD